MSIEKPIPEEKARTPNTGENAPAAGSAGKKDKKDRRKMLVINSVMECMMKKSCTWRIDLCAFGANI